VTYGINSIPIEYGQNSASETGSLPIGEGRGEDNESNSIPIEYGQDSASEADSLPIGEGWGEVTAIYIHCNFLLATSGTLLIVCNDIEV